MNKKNKILLVTIYIISILFPLKALANEGPVMDFSYSAVIPSTQLDYSKEFFYLQTKPGEKQTFGIKLTSSSEEPIVVKVDIGNAISSENGKISFGEESPQNETMKNPITEILSTKEKEVKLEPFETVQVDFDLTPPPEHFEGIKYGAITLTSRSSEKIDEVVNVDTGYRVGVIISENGNEFSNSSSLDLVKVEPTLDRGRKVVKAVIRNQEPKILENVEIDAELISKKDNKLVKKRKVIDYALAPNSDMPFIFDWGLSDLVPGEYEVKMKAKNSEYTWDLSKNFKITDKQAKKINDESPYHIVTPFWVKIVSVVLGVLVLLISIILIRRNKAWKLLLKKNRNRKSRKKVRN